MFSGCNIYKLKHTDKQGTSPSRYLYKKQPTDREKQPFNNNIQKAEMISIASNKNPKHSGRQWGVHNYFCIKSKE